jgi:hypothetical protein
LAKKDDVIELSFINTGAELFSVYTKPSLILESIEHGESALWTGHIPEDIRNETDILRIIRWLLFPVLFMTLVWVLCLSSDTVTSRVPALFSVSTYGHARSHYQITLNNALKFSKLEDTLVKLQLQNKTEEMKPVLEDIGELFDVKNITFDEVSRIRNHIEQVDLETSVIQKFFGMFTLINFMWLFAIMCLLVGIYSNFEIFLNYIWMQILNPTFGLLEIFVYLFFSMVVIEGFRFTSGLGFFITVVGIIMGSTIGYSYSRFLHSPFKPYKLNTYYTFTTFLKILPLAIYYEYTLLSWLIVSHGYDISSKTILTWICNYIGFSQQYIAVKICINSFLLHVVFITFRILGITIITSLQLPIIVIGSIQLSIGLLTVTSNYYGDIETNKRGQITYIQKQLVMVIHLLSCALVGYGLGIAVLVNTSYVFSVLYVLELCVELRLREDWKDCYLILNGNILVAFYLSVSCLYRNIDVFVSLLFYTYYLQSLNKC